MSLLPVAGVLYVFFGLFIYFCDCVCLSQRQKTWLSWTNFVKYKAKYTLITS